MTDTSQTRHRGDSSFPAGYIFAFMPLLKLVLEIPKTARTEGKRTKPSAGNGAGVYVILFRGFCGLVFADMLCLLLN